jgi:Fe2+ or Zn2+ uptake regulation protein
VNAEQLRQRLVDALAAAAEPITTSVLLATLNTGSAVAADRPIVVEEVYRGLRILADQGVVRRVTGQPGRSAHWALTGITR